MTDITKIIGDPPPRQDVKVEDALRAAINIAGEVAEDLGVPGGGLMVARLIAERAARAALHAIGVDTGHVRVIADADADVRFEVGPFQR